MPLAWFCSHVNTGPRPYIPFPLLIQNVCPADKDPTCIYTTPATLATYGSAAGHSPLIGFALDGRGLYGLYESTGTYATLDACNGHWGPVPAWSGTNTDGSAITYAAATNVYHYRESLQNI